MNYRILGTMSGSSMDGLDMAHCSFSLSPDGHLEFWHMDVAETIPYSEEWRIRLKNLVTAQGIDLIKADADYGKLTGLMIRDFVKKHRLSPDAVASHGHTLFHFPDQAFTFQLGNGSAIAAHSGLTVINHFRDLDIACGGQGAPLAPLADKWLLGQYDFYLNLGGIANISFTDGQKFIAFDITGANQILNALANTIGLEYDRDGRLASEGKADQALLHQSYELPFFSQKYPKSLGNDWVVQHLIPLFLEANAKMEDQLNTACNHIAGAIAQGIKMILEHERINKKQFSMVITGGGAFNKFLVQCIHKACNNDHFQVEIVIPGTKLVAFKEAALMALMGALRLAGLPNCLSSATGASKNSIGGGIYLS